MDLAHATAIVASAPVAPGTVATTKPASQDSGAVGDRQAPDKSAAGGEGPTVTVHSGDTLWSLAERHLGDGARFSDIAELNYGRPQSDGAHLVDDHWLRPGWALLLPADAINLPGRTGTYTVRPGTP